MTGARDHAALRELVAVHALGALDRADAGAVDAHLARCAECRAELYATSEAVLLLAASVEGPEPPPALRARILAEASAPRRRRLPRLAAPRLLRPPRLALAGLAATAALAAVVAVDARDDLARVRGDAAQDRVALAALRDAERVAPLLDGTGVRVGSVVVPRAGAPILVAALPPLPPDRTYQAWALPAGGTPVSLGLVDPDGPTALATAGDAPTLALSVEPAGGSAQPTTAPAFAAELA